MSVVKASRAEPTEKTAWSSRGSSSGLRKASRKSASMSVWVARPPEAVGEGDPLVGDPRRTAPDPLDPLQDFLLGPLGHAEVACLILCRLNRPKL